MNPPRGTLSPLQPSIPWCLVGVVPQDIMETRKIFSKFFSVGPCELRIGLYESFESLCLYLESDVATSPPSQQVLPW